MPRIRVMTEPAAAVPASFIPQWTLGDRLRKIRRHAGIGQTEFAQTLGTNQKTYASWETDKSAPRDVVAVAKRIELSTGVPAAWTLAINVPPGSGVDQESITGRFHRQSSSTGGAAAQVIALPRRRPVVTDGNALPPSAGAQHASSVPRLVAGRVEHHVPAA